MHSSNSTLKYSLILLTSIILLSCDANRDNPLDPASPDNIYISIEGKVKTERIPREPISVVEVFWQGSNTRAVTDANGSFRILDINRIDGWIHFNKSGYSSDSVYVQWDYEKVIDVEIYLNAEPSLDSLIVASKVLNDYPDRQFTYCEIITMISDEENDIDSVFVWNAELNFISPLFYNASTKYFENSFSEIDMNISSIDDIIAKEFHVIVKDRIGKIFDIGETVVKRIIRQEIDFEAPKNNIETTNPVNLQWEPFLPGFNFTYKIEVFKVVWPSAILAWQKDDIPGNLINYTVTDQLQTGDYTWVIWATDEYNNKTRSKPATFRVL